MNQSIIYIKKPENRSKSKSFGSHKYLLFKPKILRLNDISVTQNGICFKNSRMILESVQAYPDKKKIFELSGKIQLQTNPTTTFLDTEPILIIHNPWINYYHWLTETIPRIWIVRKFLSDLTLILPDFYKNLEYVTGSLKPFKFKKVIYVPDNHNVYVKNAVIPQIKPFCNYYDPRILSDLRAYYVSYVKHLNIPNPNLGDRIYILRGESLRRKIVNEPELIAFLKKYDFKSINAEQYSFYEQVSILNKAKFLISNGTGLTNMHFMNEHSCVLELKKRITNMEDFNDLVLWYMASGLNLNYYYFHCDPMIKSENMYRADLLINIKQFEKTLYNYLNDRANSS
jgi:capsular polysaccharide biosynthesis protein